MSSKINPPIHYTTELKWEAGACYWGSDWFLYRCPHLIIMVLLATPSNSIKYVNDFFTINNGIHSELRTGPVCRDVHWSPNQFIHWTTTWSSLSLFNCFILHELKVFILTRYQFRDVIEPTACCMHASISKHLCMLLQGGMYYQDKHTLVYTRNLRSMGEGLIFKTATCIHI